MSAVARSGFLRRALPGLLLLLASACGGGGAGPTPPADEAPRIMLLEIPDDDDVDDVVEDIVEDTGAIPRGRVEGTDYYRFELPAGLATDEFLAQLDDDVRVVDGELELDLEAPEGGGATLPLGGDLFAAEVARQPELLRIGLDAAHARTRGAGVRIAIVDTGIVPDHPLLVGRIAPGGRDYVDGDLDPTDVPNGIDDDRDGLVDEGHGHGTFVASLVLAVAPDAQVVPFRVLDSDSRGRAGTIASAIVAAADLGVDVINLSAGMPTRVEVVRDAVRRAEERGVVVVASAGNSGTLSVTFPAALGHGLSVTSVDPSDHKAAFASYGDEVDLSAPGVQLVGAFPNARGAVRWSGTSFSAALASGALALLHAAFPASNADELVDRLLDATVDLDALDPSYAGLVGEGRLDLDVATQP